MCVRTWLDNLQEVDIPTITWYNNIYCVYKIFTHYPWKPLNSWPGGEGAQHWLWLQKTKGLCRQGHLRKCAHISILASVWTDLPSCSSSCFLVVLVPEVVRASHGAKRLSTNSPNLKTNESHGEDCTWTPGKFTAGPTLGSSPASFLGTQEQIAFFDFCNTCHIQSSLGRINNIYLKTWGLLWFSTHLLFCN